MRILCTYKCRESRGASNVPDGRLLRIDEAAEYLGISKTTVRRWTKVGCLLCVRINERGDRRFHASALENVIPPKRPGRPKKLALGDHASA
ncbi:MAG: helix-turn-helix domain-containing protein [Calditrichaeota bacterium]|nr:helix-turn-helix domain-containing protein [Calditrichota bacterium]MCB9367668.1 helix-turn-helix domain-containing protein [Calditrichota bacterium]